MFIYGTDNTTLRAWPVSSIKSVMFNPAADGKKDELAIHLSDNTTVWLKDREARETWKQIIEKGIGYSDNTGLKD